MPRSKRCSAQRVDPKKYTCYVTIVCHQQNNPPSWSHDKKKTDQKPSPVQYKTPSHKKQANKKGRLLFPGQYRASTVLQYTKKQGTKEGKLLFSGTLRNAEAGVLSRMW